MAEYEIEDNRAGSTKLQGAPFNFVQSGLYNISTGVLSNTGFGFYRTGTAITGDLVYGFTVAVLGAYSSNADRGYGIALRCVAR